jgi:RNA polymerase sigma-70 factor (ECF subfamily)
MQATEALEKMTIAACWNLGYADAPESLAFRAPTRLKISMPLSTPQHTAAPAVLPRATPPANHADLLVRVGRDRDRAAFTELFRYFAPRIKSYLLKHGADDAAAEEIVQSAFVSIWEKAASFDPARAAASTWIFTIARNRRIDALRREKFIEVDSDSTALAQAAADTDAAPYADADTSARLDAAIDDLPEEQARLVRMAYFEDKSHQAIAAETELPLGTVKSRLRLAMEKLRARMGLGGGAGEGT